MGRAIALFTRAWLGTTRFREHFENPAYNPHVYEVPKALYAAWHETIFVTAWQYGGFGNTVLVSKSNDGEIITGAARSLGWNVIRGSSNKAGAAKGATAAVRETIELIERSK